MIYFRAGTNNFLLHSMVSIQLKVISKGNIMSYVMDSSNGSPLQNRLARYSIHHSCIHSIVFIIHSLCGGERTKSWFGRYKNEVSGLYQQLRCLQPLHGAHMGIVMTTNAFFITLFCRHRSLKQISVELCHRTHCRFCFFRESMCSHSNCAGDITLAQITATTLLTVQLKHLSN